MVLTDPSAGRRALRLRLEADRLVRDAFRRHEAVTSGPAAATVATGTLVAEVSPVLERAERFYLESLDVDTSQPTLLFQLGEVNFLLGRRARAYQFLARYWEAIGEAELARSYRRRARETAPEATVPLAGDGETTGPG
jgi:hypothetical protein